MRRFVSGRGRGVRGLSFSPSSVALGPVTGVQGGSDTRGFYVINAGTAAVPFTLNVGGTHASMFSVTPTSGSAGSALESVKFTVPGLSGAGTKNASVTVMTNAPLCGASPTLTLTGTIN